MSAGDTNTSMQLLVTTAVNYAHESVAIKLQFKSPSSVDL